MMLLTPELRAALRANDIARHAAAREGQTEPDPLPVVKFFNPVGAATWLATELFADDDTLFVLSDLRFGTPELGVFSLFVLAVILLPSGLCLDRDTCFARSVHLPSVLLSLFRLSFSLFLLPLYTISLF